MAFGGLSQVAPEFITVQAQTPICSFTAAGVRAAFPIMKDEVTGGNRIIRFTRPYRNGAKLDDTGKIERVWTMTCEFNNTIQEAGLDDTPLYPDLMLKVLKLFDAKETGDLIVPTDGKVRARAETYKRETPNEWIDYAILTLTFVEDSEDGITTAAFSNPTVSGRHIRLIQKTQFSAEEEDAWSNPISDLTELGSQLEGALRAPGRAVEDSEAQARAVVGVCANLGRAVVEVAGTARNEGTSPPSIKTQLNLLALAGLMANVRDERQSSMPARRPYTVKAQTTAFFISSDVGQPVEAIMDLNPNIEDAFVVLPGTYQVYERWT